MKTIIINNKTFKLSLDYILGLFEGDGSFIIQLKPNSSHKSGNQVILKFIIHQHVVDVDLLEAISVYLGYGKVEVGKRTGSPETWVYRFNISRQADILNFCSSVLLSQHMVLKKRQNDLNLFIKACSLVSEKSHLESQGQLEISKLASMLASKLSVEDKSKLPEISSSLSNERILGFVDAEGNFSYSFRYSDSNPNYVGVNFNFNVTQEKSELKFLESLIGFFGCGNVFVDKEGIGRFVVNNKKDLLEKILPFFEVNELQTIKQVSFLNFKKALNICLNNKPLQQIHIAELKSLKSNMTNNRI